jgi:hypothetical protein
MAPKGSVASSTTPRGPRQAQGRGTAALRPPNVRWALGARDAPSGNMLQVEINAQELSPLDIRNQEAEVAKYMMHERAWIPFEKIQTENGMALGQSRQLDTKRVTEYVADVIANPRRGPLEDTLAIPTAHRGMCPQYATSRTRFWCPRNCRTRFYVRDVASPFVWPPRARFGTGPLMLFCWHPVFAALSDSAQDLRLLFMGYATSRTHMARCTFFLESDVWFGGAVPCARYTWVSGGVHTDSYATSRTPARWVAILGRMLVSFGAFWCLLVPFGALAYYIYWCLFFWDAFWLFWSCHIVYAIFRVRGRHGTRTKSSA